MGMWDHSSYFCLQTTCSLVMVSITLLTLSLNHLPSECAHQLHGRQSLEVLKEDSLK